MSAADGTSATGVLSWPAAPSGAATEREGRHRAGVRAALTWHRMLYSGKHRR